LRRNWFDSEGDRGVKVKIHVEFLRFEPAIHHFYDRFKVQIEVKQKKMRTRDGVVVQQLFFLPYSILDLSFTIRRQLNSEPPCKLHVSGWVLLRDLQID